MVNTPPQPRAFRSKWVTFDCYGTLVDWHSGFTAILNPVAGEETTGLLHAYHRFEPRVEAERPHRSYREVLTTSLLLAAKEIGLSLTEAQALRLPEQWGSLPVFGDVEDALTAIRTNGFKLAVLTNCDEDLFVQTQRSFRQKFDLVTTAERVHAYKPSLAHFRCFQTMTAVDAADWVHVASSWFHDIAPARELGIKHVWLDRENAGDHANELCLSVTSAESLPKAIAEIVPKHFPYAIPLCSGDRKLLRRNRFSEMRASPVQCRPQPLFSDRLRHSEFSSHVPEPDDGCLTWYILCGKTIESKQWLP